MTSLNWTFFLLLRRSLYSCTFFVNVWYFHRNHKNVRIKGYYINMHTNFLKYLILIRTYWCTYVYIHVCPCIVYWKPTAFCISFVSFSMSACVFSIFQCLVVGKRASRHHHLRFTKKDYFLLKWIRGAERRYSFHLHN